MNTILVAHILYWLYLLFNFIFFIIGVLPNFVVIYHFIILGCVDFLLLSIITLITIKNQLRNIQTFKNKYSTFGIFMYYFIFNVINITLNSLLITYKNFDLIPSIALFSVFNFIFGGLHYMFITVDIIEDTSETHPYIEIHETIVNVIQ